MDESTRGKNQADIHPNQHKKRSTSLKDLLPKEKVINKIRLIARLIILLVLLSNVLRYLVNWARRGAPFHSAFKVVHKRLQSFNFLLFWLRIENLCKFGIVTPPTQRWSWSMDSSGVAMDEKEMVDVSARWTHHRRNHWSTPCAESTAAVILVTDSQHPRQTGARTNRTYRHR